MKSLFPGDKGTQYDQIYNEKQIEFFVVVITPSVVQSQVKIFFNRPGDFYWTVSFLVIRNNTRLFNFLSPRGIELDFLLT